MAKSNIRNIKFIAWERSGCCRAFQATAPIYDNWVWLARACKFLCAPVRTQLLPTPARRAPVCAGPLAGIHSDHPEWMKRKRDEENTLYYRSLPPSRGTAVIDTHSNENTHSFVIGTAVINTHTLSHRPPQTRRTGARRRVEQGQAAKRSRESWTGSAARAGTMQALPISAALIILALLLAVPVASGYCSVGCNDGMPGDGECDIACMTRACGYDGIDCETVLPFDSVALVHACTDTKSPSPR